MKTIVFSAQKYDRDFLDAINKDFGHEITFLDTQLNATTVKFTVGYEAVCVFVNDILNKEIIEALSVNGIKIIALRCAGFNNVDLKAVLEKNIRVVRVPAYSPHAVAEHAITLLLSLDRKIYKAYNRVREGDFALDGLMGFDLYKKTVGVIGTGNIGQVFCRIMLGFGCIVKAFDITVNKELEALGVEYLPLDNLLSQSDIVSLHCPLTKETHHLINASTIGKMKQGAILINTGRGGLINTQDTIDALKKGQLGGLGIDVYEQEEKLFYHDLSAEVIQDDVISRLMTFPNVIITGHQGFFTREALTQIATITLGNIKDFEEGKVLVNEVKGS